MDYLEKIFRDRPLSLEKFNAVVGAVMLWGMLVSAFAANLLGGVLSLFMKPWLLVIAWIILCLIGITITRKSERPLISFAGFTLVLVATAVNWCAFLRHFKTIKMDLIPNALMITAGVILVMLVATWLMPKIFIKMNRALVVATIGLIIIGAIAYFAGWFKTGWWDAIVAAVLSLYVCYTWSKALKSTLTFDSAIDGCLGLFSGISDLLENAFSPLTKKTGPLGSRLKKFRVKLKDLF